MPRAYRLKQPIDPSKKDDLAYLLRLMMSVDAMRSALRWSRSLTKGNTVVYPTDRLMSWLTAMGWGGEALCLVQRGIKQGLVDKAMLDDRPELLDTWDKAFAPDHHPFIKKMHRARDNYSAHWDNYSKITPPFVALLLNGGNDVPFIETDESGKFGNSRFPWAFTAICRDLFGPNIDDNAQGNAKGLGEEVAAVSQMVNLIALGVAQRIGLEWEEINPEGS